MSASVPVAIGIVGEYRADFEPSAATEAALSHSAHRIDLPLRREWLPTDTLVGAADGRLEGFDGLWIAPGSPYRSLEGALDAIRYARSRGVPLLGTCAGLQHIVLEILRHVAGLADAESEQYAPNAERLVIRELECVVRGRELPIDLEPGSRASAWYGSSTVVERYFCTYGLDPGYTAELESLGFRISGRDAINGEPRILEGVGSEFLVGTLFVPQVRSSRSSTHPLIDGFLRAAFRHHRDRSERDRGASHRTSPGRRVAPATGPGAEA